MNFDIKLFIYLSLGFIVATIVGTLSHEFGHYIVAEGLGYDASVDYGSTHIEHYNLVPPLHRFWITFGGPIETILTGSVGLLLILRCRNSFVASQELTGRKWIMVFVTLFWLRQLSNFVWGWIGFLKKGKFSARADESKLDRYLGLPGETFITISAICAVIVLLLVIFRFIPKSQRFVFLVSGLIGGISGFYLWLHLLGKIILP
jgi:hypothetical protein